MRLEEQRHHETFKTYHWIFLALPSPLPETMIGHDPEYYIRFTSELIFGWRDSGVLMERRIDSQQLDGYRLEEQARSRADEDMDRSIRPVEGRGPWDSRRLRKSYPFCHDGRTDKPPIPSSARVHQ